MNSGYLKYAGAALLAVICCAIPESAPADMREKPQNLSVSLGAEFATGNYGTDATTRSLYLPLIATWSPDERFDIGIEVPFIYQSRSNVTTGIYHASLSATAEKTAPRTGAGGSGGSGLQPQAQQHSASGPSKSDVSGLGDIILRLGVIALFEAANTPQLRPSLSIKFPTASFSDGLGTGEFDLGVGVEASKWFGAARLTGEGIYNYQGKADGLGLNNFLSFSAGAGYQLGKSLHPMLVLKGATAPSAYSGDLLELRARLICSLSAASSLDLYLSHGLAGSSPDHGGGIAAVFGF